MENWSYESIKSETMCQSGADMQVCSELQVFNENNPSKEQGTEETKL